MAYQIESVTLHLTFQLGQKDRLKTGYCPGG
jgi:hypothetical protein